ncbi:MAG: hypothetical protein H7X97_08905 [Opitutaceae bacterium]|nr:hypothetical protein [Verrucomicrobiales bacterium]
MQPIKKDELFRHLGDFLKSKGIELTNGSFTAPIQEGCDLLSDTINATQKTVEHTKTQVNEALDHLRQSIHERTAPKPTASPSPEPPGSGQKSKARSNPEEKPRAKRPLPKVKARRRKQ